MRSAERLTVPIVLDRTAERPLHEQLIDAMREAIGIGLLPEGSRLPSTRTLADVLGVSRGVAIAAYERLYATGAIRGTPGSGTYVSGQRSRLAELRTERARRADPVDLRPGQAAVEGFPLAAWRAAWRQASYDPPPPGLPPAHGTSELRAAVVEHVRRVHGVAGTDHDVMITSGRRHAIAFLLRALGTYRVRLALADPGPAWLRDAITARGAEAVPVPLDAEGLRVDLLPSGVDAVLVAPEGGVPLGARTSLRRRLELADWAQRRGGWLVELAREATTDHKARPLPSLLVLGPRRRTALIGDLAEILTPAIGLGYLVLPRELCDLAAEQVATLREQPALPCQRAASELFRTGSVARRVTQLAPVHHRKLAIVREVLEPIGLEVLDARVPGNATVLLPKGLPADHLIRCCDEAGIRLDALHVAYARRQDAPNGLALGVGHLSDAVLRTALRAVAAMIRDLGTPVHRVA